MTDTMIGTAAITASGAATVPHAGGHGTESSRVRLASSTYTPGHVLSQLARDPAVTVRAAVAMNPACSPHLDHAISQDRDERVRALLGRKLALLMPSLSGDENVQTCEQVQVTLTALAMDTAVRVRAVIADCVKDMPSAPRDLILQLAHDTALPVCDPIIRLSPLLTDADLLGLLAVPPHPGIATSVASRLGLSATVADAVAVQADSAAIRALLSNRSAAIQEATLDALIGQAERHPDWHAPLVQRPVLTAQAARALSGFVAAQLIDVLAQRADLDPAVADELRLRVAARLHPEEAAAPVRDADDKELIASLRRLNAAGMLNEAELVDAARVGDQRRVAAALAVASGLSLAAVDRAASLRNAKGLVSVVWKAGFTMRAAVIVQAMLGQLSPGMVMLPGPGETFPLTADEMRWQLEVLGQPGR